jgi:hypothetical protein
MLRLANAAWHLLLLVRVLPLLCLLLSAAVWPTAADVAG